jgi:membrane associated rhomboid family serine protease
LSQPDYVGRPSICRNCGALVGAGENTCSVCGAASTAVEAEKPPRPAHDHETMRFARAVLNRPYIFTIIFLIANIFVFMLMWSASGMGNNALSEFPFQVLIAYGAKLNSMINRQHEWWRFVTPVFIHVNLIHLMVNMYSLWVVGPYVEKLYGSAKFVVFWVLTGAAGVMASYLTVRPGVPLNSLGRFLFKQADTPSAGASGALFGLVGVLFVFGIKFRRELPEGFKRAFGTGLLPMILLNLFIGYLGRGFIDNAAHLGGLGAGAALALMVGYKRPGERTSVSVSWHVLQAAALLLVVVSFVMVARRYNVHTAPANAASAPVTVDDQSELIGYINALNGGLNAFSAARVKGEAGGIEAAIKALDDAGPPDERARALRDDLKALLTRTREYLAQLRARLDRQRIRAQEQALDSALDSWVAKRDEWIKTDGEKYGIVIEQPPSPEKDSKDSPAINR